MPPDAAHASTPDADAAATAFIQRWQGVTASELSSAQSFFIELCALLDVAPPHPTPQQDYMFERPVVFHHGDGSTSSGRVDCYKRGHFVWESKKLKAGLKAQGSGHAGLTSKAFDAALLAAHRQAQNYARALPASAQPWPPQLPAQVRVVAQLLSASPAALPLPAIEAAFKGKGPWKKGLPRILETLEALGRARRVDGGAWRG